MSTIEEAREQAREALELVHAWRQREQAWDTPRALGFEKIGQAIRTLLDATEPSTVAVKTEFRVLDAPKDCDYHEGFEEGVKVGRAGSGPRPITDEMVEAAAGADFEFGKESMTWDAWAAHDSDHADWLRKKARAALEAAEEARR